MKNFGVLQRVASRSGCRFPNGRFPVPGCQVWSRSIATQNAVDKATIEKLPLAGIRVLDMTRVLAGVGGCFILQAVQSH